MYVKFVELDTLFTRFAVSAIFRVGSYSKVVTLIRNHASKVVTDSSNRWIVEEECRCKRNAQVLAQLSHQLCGRQRIEPHLHERSLEVHGLVCVAVKQRLDAFNDLRSDQGLDLLEVLTCIL